MKAIKIVKFVGIAAVTLLFITLMSSGFIFEATHTVTQTLTQNILSPTDFNILQVETSIITSLCVTYTLLLLPWILYFMKIEKKSGLQYFSLYPLTGGKASKIAAIALTVLNATTAIGFYILYMRYTHVTTLRLAESQLSILTLLCFAIIFWGGTYLVYGSVYGVKRVKNIIKKKREKRKARREQTSKQTQV